MRIVACSTFVWRRRPSGCECVPAWPVGAGRLRALDLPERFPAPRNPAPLRSGIWPMRLNLGACCAVRMVVLYFRLISISHRSPFSDSASAVLPRKVLDKHFNPMYNSVWRRRQHSGACCAPASDVSSAERSCSTALLLSLQSRRGVSIWVE